MADKPLPQRRTYRGNPDVAAGGKPAEEKPAEVTQEAPPVETKPEVSKRTALELSTGAARIKSFADLRKE